MSDFFVCHKCKKKFIKKSSLSIHLSSPCKKGASKAFSADARKTGIGKKKLVEDFT